MREVCSWYGWRAHLKLVHSVDIVLELVERALLDAALPAIVSVWNVREEVVHVGKLRYFVLHAIVPALVVLDGVVFFDKLQQHLNVNKATQPREAGNGLYFWEQYPFA